MSLALLSAVVEAPADPREPGTAASWTEVESQLGTPLPGDYKEFVSAYGTGSIGSFLWAFNPFAQNEHLNLAAQVPIRLDALRELQEKHAAERVYALFPDAGGLLPWGATDNGDVLFWRTTGAPDEWMVVVNASRDARYEEHPYSMTRFLYEFTRGNITSQILPDDFGQQAEDRVFEPE